MSIGLVPTGLAPTGIDAEFGAPGGALTVTATGIASAEGFGTARLNLNIVGVGGDDHTQPFYMPTVEQWWPITITAIGSAEGFGTARLDHRLDLIGAASAEVFGGATVNLDLGQSITVTAIGSAEGFGIAQFVQSGVIATNPIASAEAFGTAQLDFRLVAGATASAEAFGSTQVALDTSQTVSAVGSITTAEAFGTERLDFDLLLTGLASAGAFGAFVVQGGVQDAFGETRPGSSLSAETKRIGFATLVPSNDGKIG